MGKILARCKASLAAVSPVISIYPTLNIAHHINVMILPSLPSSFSYYPPYYIRIFLASLHYPKCNILPLTHFKQLRIRNRSCHSNFFTFRNASAAFVVTANRNCSNKA
jgi:hypothetical protein